VHHRTAGVDHDDGRPPSRHDPAADRARTRPSRTAWVAGVDANTATPSAQAVAVDVGALVVVLAGSGVGAFLAFRPQIRHVAVAVTQTQLRRAYMACHQTGEISDGDHTLFLDMAGEERNSGRPPPHGPDPGARRTPDRRVGRLRGVTDLPPGRRPGRAHQGEVGRDIEGPVRLTAEPGHRRQPTQRAGGATRTGPGSHGPGHIVVCVLLEVAAAVDHR
jgi:hypothetical protein